MNRQGLDMTDEHFMVWMRPAPFPNFTKLYGRINEDLEAGTQLTIYINHSKYYDKSEINNESLLFHVAVAHQIIIVQSINSSKNF